MKTCDVIIPAHGGEETLQEVLACLDAQVIPAGWHVSIIVCDDGSAPALQARTTRLPLRIIRQQQKGAAAARNTALKESQADVVVLLGADILLRPGALSRHLEFHHAYPGESDAALGIVGWDPRLKPTPLMEWAVHGGPQNDFDTLLGEQVVPIETFFYGSHVSCKRSVLVKDMFNEAFREYGHEDTELGVRLAQAGIRLHVLHAAIGLHRHFYSASDFLRRQYAVGRSRHIFCRVVGLPNPLDELKRMHLLQLKVYRFGFGLLLTILVRLVSNHYSLPRLFSHVAAYMYRLGVLAGPPSSKVR